MSSAATPSVWQSEYAGKHCTVIGGCGGLGSSVVKQLLDAGAKVTVIDALIQNNPFPRTDVEAHAKNFGTTDNCQFIKADSAEEDQISDAMKQANEKFGAIDCHFDTAWRWLPGPKRTIIGASQADWETSNKNITGASQGIKYAHKYFSKKNNAVVLCGAFADQSACPALMGATFGAGHAARNQLVRDAAVELAPTGVRVNAVNAGAMRDTPMYQFVGKKMFGTVDNMVCATIKPGGFLSHTTMQRAGTSTEVANSLLYMGSSLSSYTTGQKLYADGGLNSGLPMQTLHGGFEGVSEKDVESLSAHMAQKK